MKKLSQKQTFLLLHEVALDNMLTTRFHYAENLYTSHVGGIDLLRQEDLDMINGEISDDLLIFVTGGGHSTSDEEMMYLIKECEIRMEDVAIINVDDEHWWIFNF